MNHPSNLKESVMRLLFTACACVSILAVALICLFLFANGLPAIGKIGPLQFLLGQSWKPGNDIYGILPMILGSVYVTAGALVVGVPIGLLTAIYMSRFASPAVNRVLQPAVELLAGIPSVVYGLVGMIVLVPAVQGAFNLSSGATLLAAIVVLTIMILPYIVNVSSTALDAVPKEYEEGSLALGATNTETYFKVSLHAARSGVATAIIQGVGRALGEAMAIIMVAGNVANMPALFESVRFLTTAIVSEMSYASYGSLHREALFSVGLVLFVFIVLVNVVLNIIARRKEQ